MADTTYGTAHLHGIGATISNATILEVNLDKGFSLDQKTQDESGVTIENRMDDKTITGSVRLLIRSGFTHYVQGAVLTLAGLNDTALNTDYAIKSVGEAYRSGEKIEVTVNLESHEGIDYTP